MCFPDRCSFVFVACDVPLIPLCRKIGADPSRSSLNHRDELLLATLPSLASMSTGSDDIGPSCCGGDDVCVKYPPVRGVSMMEPSDEELLMSHDTMHWVVAASCRPTPAQGDDVEQGIVTLVCGNRGGAIAVWKRRPQL